MEVLLIALAISLLIALIPVRARAREDIINPSPITRPFNSRPSIGATMIRPPDVPLEDTLDSLEPRDGQFATRVRTETITCEGKTYVVAEYDGMLIIREDS